ncbi:UNVERIFIED_CONTAM: hypothetical protein FKN15_071754 [Acipenser sinensis]
MAQGSPSSTEEAGSQRGAKTGGEDKVLKGHFPGQAGRMDEMGECGIMQDRLARPMDNGTEQDQFPHQVPPNPDTLRYVKQLSKAEKATSSWLLLSAILEPMAQQGTSPDTLPVPEVEKPPHEHAGLNEDLVKILRENLLQHDKPRATRKSTSISPRLSPAISPRNSPRLLRRMMLNNNTQKKRRFTVAHTW